MATDLFERLVNDLRRRGVTEADIDDLRSHWAALQKQAALPCPLCTLRTRKRGLVLNSSEGVDGLDCPVCHESFVLSPK